MRQRARFQPFGVMAHDSLAGKTFLGDFGKYKGLSDDFSREAC